MLAHVGWLATLAFGLGIVVQGLLMLRGAFRPGDATRAGWAALIGVVGLAPLGGEHPYSPLRQVPFALAIAALAFAYLFRDRLLSRIGARHLLAWNILLVYALVCAGWASEGALLALIPPTYLTVVNAFTDIDRNVRLRVVLHVWFLVILVLIGVTGFDAGPLRMFLHGRDPAAVLSPAQMFITGAAYLYIIANAWFVLALVPIPISRGQKWSEREEQIARHMKLLARGYAWERHDIPRSLVVLVALPALLFAAARWAPDRGHLVLGLAIALMPWLDGDAEPRASTAAPRIAAARGR